MSYTRLESLQALCLQYDFGNVNSFSHLLQSAVTVFPGIDREISSLYDVSIDTVLLWREGSIIPDNLTQTDIVRFVHSKARDYREAAEVGRVDRSMVVYDSRVPADYIPNEVPFFQPGLSHIKSLWNSWKAYFYFGDVTATNLQQLIGEARKDREAIFHAKLSRRISRCNRAIVRAVRKNMPSIACRIGKKTIENVRLANAVRDYLRSIGFGKVETMFQYSLTVDGDVYVEINLL
jgi:hypothetical protein